MKGEREIEIDWLIWGTEIWKSVSESWPLHLLISWLGDLWQQVKNY